MNTILAALLRWVKRQSNDSYLMFCRDLGPLILSFVKLNRPWPHLLRPRTIFEVDEMVEVFKMDWSVHNGLVLRWAVLHNPPIIDYLLKKLPLWLAAAQENFLVRKAAALGHVDLLRTLLALPHHAKVNPASHNYEALKKAAGNGHLEVVRILCSTPLAAPTYARIDALKVAIGRGRSDVVHLLLQSPTVRTQKMLELILMTSAATGDLEMVRDAVFRYGVDPSLHDNFALNLSLNGHYNQVSQFLLKQPRVREIFQRKTDRLNDIFLLN